MQQVTHWRLFVVFCRRVIDLKRVWCRVALQRGRMRMGKKRMLGKGWRRGKRLATILVRRENGGRLRCGTTLGRL